MGDTGLPGGASTNQKKTSSPGSTDHPADPEILEETVGTLVGVLSTGVHFVTKAQGDRWIATEDERRMAGMLVCSIAERHTDLTNMESSDVLDGLGLAILGGSYVARNLMEAAAERRPRGVTTDEGGAG